MDILATKTGSFFLMRWIQDIQGLLMDGIFRVLNAVGIPNIGLAIIIFTIVIYLCLLPLTIRQQKFSKLQAKMNPELQKIRDKYKDRKDNDSMMAMNQETNAVYAKYGVSPTGSCLQLLIQLPILWSLYRVIYAIPAYVAQVKNAFFPLVDELIGKSGSAEFLQSLSGAQMYAKQFTNESFTSGVTEYVQNTYIDVLYRSSTTDWSTLLSQYPDLSESITKTTDLLSRYNNFLGLNIGDSPSVTFHNAWASGAYLMCVAALLIPVLSAVTQWISVKLMPNQNTQPTGDSTADSMAQSMKTMNVMMPIMSAVFCFTLPAGMGIYWIAGAVIRGIQQVVINKQIDKIDWDKEIEKNKAKAAKKLEKAGLTGNLSSYAEKSTRAIQAAAGEQQQQVSQARLSRRERITRNSSASSSVDSSGLYVDNPKKGSIAEKINLVSDYNDYNR
ncbi:MAG: YidC/Oxa1 family membrane protein insertase [Lachnospiraceae bacterium]|nr:YidC/Oxa1 family membrane protein insertase [Lachnospiraceae bacterium]